MTNPNRPLVTQPPRLPDPRTADRPNGYVEWVAYDDGVMLRFVEEPAR